MALFGRRRADIGRPEVQYPDELAHEAAAAYGVADFVRALELYSKSVDKLHSMCVVTPVGSRIRTPGTQDQPILDGLTNSLGAALAMDPQLSVDPVVASCVGYLRQIAAEAGAEAGRYETAIQEIEITMRLTRKPD